MRAAAWITLACAALLPGRAPALPLDPGRGAGIEEARRAPHGPAPSPYDRALESHRSAEIDAVASVVLHRSVGGVQPGIYGGPPPIDTPGAPGWVLLGLAGAALGLARRRRS